MSDFSDSTLPPPCAKCGAPVSLARTCAECGHRHGTDIAWQPGDHLSIYTLIARIDGGKGGMGQVWRVCQQDDRDIVHALKLIRPDRAGAVSESLFLRERQLLVAISHTNIARILQTGMAGRQPYFVMEWVACGEGQQAASTDLVTFARQRALSLEDKLRLFQKVCAAAHYLHRNGIVHRDLKPDNVLIAHNGSVTEPKIIDLGVARRIDLAELHTATSDSADAGRTLSGQYVGTPVYSAPEQLVNAAHVSPQSDVYSLGAILLQLLAGVRPLHREESELLLKMEAWRKAGVQRENDADLEPLLKSLKTKERPRARTLAPDLPSDLQAVLDKALHKDPARRYATAEDFARDLEHWLRGEPVMAWKAQVPWFSAVQRSGYKTLRFVQRHKAATISTAAAFAALVTGGAVAWSSRNEATRALQETLRETQQKTEALAAREEEARQKTEALAAKEEEARQKNQALANLEGANTALGKVNADLQATTAKADKEAAEARKQAGLAQENAARAEENAKRANEALRAGARTLAQSDFDTAQRFLDSNQAAEAMAYLVRALRNDPTHAPARTRLATLLLQRRWAIPRPVDLIKEPVFDGASIGRGGKPLWKAGKRDLVKTIKGRHESSSSGWFSQELTAIVRGEKPASYQKSLDFDINDKSSPLSKLSLSPDGGLIMAENSVIFGNYRGTSEGIGSQVIVADVATGFCCNHGKLNSEHLFGTAEDLAKIAKDDEELKSKLSELPYEVRLRIRDLSKDEVVWAGFSPNSQMYAQVWSSGWVTVHQRIDMSDLKATQNLLREGVPWGPNNRPLTASDMNRDEQGKQPGSVSWQALEPFPIDLAAFPHFGFTQSNDCFVASDDERNPVRVWSLVAPAAVASVQYWAVPPFRASSNEDPDANGTESAVFDASTKTLYGVVPGLGTGQAEGYANDTVRAVSIVDSSERWSLPLRRIIKPLINDEDQSADCGLGDLWMGTMGQLFATAAPSRHQDSAESDFRGIISIDIATRKPVMHLPKANSVFSDGPGRFLQCSHLPVWRKKSGHLWIDFHDLSSMQLKMSSMVPDKVADTLNLQSLWGAVVSQSAKLVALLACQAEEHKPRLMVWSTETGRYRVWKNLDSNYLTLGEFSEQGNCLYLIDDSGKARSLAVDLLDSTTVNLEIEKLGPGPIVSSPNWWVFDSSTEGSGGAPRLVSRVGQSRPREIVAHRPDLQELEGSGDIHLSEALRLLWTESSWKREDSYYSNWSRYELDDGVRFHFLEVHGEAADPLRISGRFRNVSLDSSGWFCASSFNQECLLFRFPMGEAVVPEALLNAAEALGGLKVDGLALVPTPDPAARLQSALSASTSLPPADYWTELLRWIATPPEDRSAAPWTRVKPATRK